MKSKLSIISFLVIVTSIFAQDYQVVNSSSNSILIEVTPKYTVDTLEIDNQEYLRINYSNSIVESEDFGKPDIRYSILPIGVRNEFGNTFRVVSSNYKILKGQISPIPFIKKSGDFYVNEFKITPDYNIENQELILPGKFGYARHLAVQDLKVFPIQFDQENNSIKIYERIVIEVKLANQNLSGSIKQIDDLASSSVINSDQVNGWTKDINLAKTAASVPSVLSNGTWYKFPITDEGIYKIDAATLTAMGISTNGLDPRTIKIYNNGGKILPWAIDETRPNDLQELAIKVEGESDGVFNENDFILFYGRGVNFWDYDKASNNINRNKNWYSKENYFWLTFGSSNGKRIVSEQSEVSSNTIVQNSTKAFVFNDEDNLNVIKSGVVYVSDEYSSAKQSYTYINPILDHVPGTAAYYNYSFANVGETNVPFSLEENGQTILTTTLTRPFEQYQPGILLTGSAAYNGNYTDNRSVLKISFTPTNLVSKGYLDFFEIEFERNLKAIEDELVFFSKDTNGVIDYRLSNFSTSSNQVFVVTDYNNVKLISPEFISGGEIRFKKSQISGNVSKFYAANSSKYKVPSGFEKISNSFVRAESEGVEYIIITHREFKSAAEKLLNHRSVTSDFPLTSKIFYTDEIFNEFSSGVQDPTAMRDFIKYAFENWNTEPKYVNLFGGGTYDYLNTEGRNNNFVPSFQTIESLHEIKSYSFDDYFGRISGADEKADIAVGRLPANNIENAEVIVNKIIFYETNKDEGLWRNRITLVADDGLTSSGDDGSLHTRQSEELSAGNVPSYFDQQKIYLANYPAVITGLGRRKPTVNQAIIDAINNGTVLLNYIGHGNPDVWAHEFVFERSSTIPQLSNDIYPFLTAATCDFGKFDDPLVESGAEDLIFLPTGGLIGVFTAVRPVYSNQNARLNEKFYDNLFASSNNPVRIGIGYYKTKIAATGDNDERFHLFCDPALILAVPQKPIDITSVNGENLNTNVQIKALGTVEVKGNVVNADSSVNTAFNGEGIVTVFDSKRKVFLEEIRYNVEYQGGLIFRGKVSVNNGAFATSFTVPKDISYENQNGKIIAYLFNNETTGIGVTQNIIVGGTDSTVTNDGKGPDIDIYFDDLSYTNAYLVNKDFNLLVKLDDQTGLNTTGTGIGHKLEGIINDDNTNPIDFTNYFIGDLDAGGKSGLIDYKFSNYQEGDYKIKIKAWDVFNNLSSSEEYFSVVGDGGLSIRDVFNYPNPFRGSTNFTFQHNLTETIDVQIKVYTIAGRLIKEINSFGLNDKFIKVPWDGRDEDGNILANGTYLYKLNIKTVDGSLSENILGKLTVIR